MKYEIEERIVNDFISSAYCERVLFELKSSKKRLNAIMRFSHNIESLLKKEKICLKLQHFDKDKFKQFLQSEKLYVISFKYLDGIFLNIDDVLDYISDEYSSVIVFDNDRVIIKKEFEKGEDNFYFLKN